MEKPKWLTLSANFNGVSNILIINTNWEHCTIGEGDQFDVFYPPCGKKGLFAQ
ncbi:hypothetical protein [Pedobacter steynii]